MAIARCRASSAAVTGGCIAVAAVWLAVASMSATTADAAAVLDGDYGE